MQVFTFGSNRQQALLLLLSNVKTYMEGNIRITFEEIPYCKLGYNLGFHIHLKMVFQ